MSTQWVASLGPQLTVASAVSTVDLDAYFARIGYTGSRDPTLQTLHQLCYAHVSSIPFENLDVVLGRGVRLAPGSVDTKILECGRGGYCFEHNTLFLRVLSSLGFTAEPLSARVRLGRPSDSNVCPRTHLFLLVTVDDTRWLADVGVGGYSVTCALRLDTTDVQETPHEPRRIVKEGALYIHQVRLGEKWVDVSDFTLESMPPVDQEVANWFTTSHPNSRMGHQIIACRALVNGGRVSLINCILSIKDKEGRATTTEASSPEHLLELLNTHFSLRFPEGTVFPSKVENGGILADSESSPARTSATPRGNCDNCYTVKATTATAMWATWMMELGLGICIGVAVTHVLRKR